MGIIKMHNNVPDIYTTSRDFQLLLNLQSLVFNGNKFDVDTIEDITSTANIRSSLLPLLAQKVGFFTDKSLNDEEWRYVLLAFPYLLKNKGTFKAIAGAVNAFLHLKGIEIVPSITLNRNTEQKAYTVIIALDTSVVDTMVLEEVLKYILPVGWEYEITFRKDFTSTPIEIEFSQINNEIDEIVLTEYDDGSTAFSYIPTANVRSSNINPPNPIGASYAQNILIGAADMGYVQGSNSASNIYLIEGNPSYTITINVNIPSAISPSGLISIIKPDSNDITIQLTADNYTIDSLDIRSGNSNDYFDSSTNTIYLHSPYTQNIIINVDVSPIAPTIQLMTPIISSVTGSQVSWGAVPNATSYTIKIDNDELGSYNTTASGTLVYDVSTFTGWADVGVGEHLVFVKATAPGYLDSAYSSSHFIYKS